MHRNCFLFEAEECLQAYSTNSEISREKQVLLIMLYQLWLVGDGSEFYKYNYYFKFSGESFLKIILVLQESEITMGNKLM